jgi:Tol biopolymer transport system component
MTTNPSVDNVPIWSADGKTVAFASAHGKGLDIYQRPANQSAPDQLLLKLDAPPIMFPADSSSDGQLSRVLPNRSQARERYLGAAAVR